MEKIVLSKEQIAALKAQEQKVGEMYENLVAKMLLGQDTEEMVVDVFEAMYEWMRLYVHPPETPKKRLISRHMQRVLWASTFMTLGSCIGMQMPARAFLKIARPEYDHIKGYPI